METFLCIIDPDDAIGRLWRKLTGRPEPELPFTDFSLPAGPPCLADDPLFEDD